MKNFKSNKNKIIIGLMLSSFVLLVFQYLKSYKAVAYTTYRPTSGYSAEKVRKYCQGSKYDKSNCYWACSDLKKSITSDEEYIYEKKLCVETQCKKNDDKTDDGYMTGCGMACSMMGDKHIMCVKKDIIKYCQNSSTKDETKCSRYCAKAGNNHELCKNKTYFKSFIEDEDCNKYCNKTSKNFNENKCNEKCGGMFDRYNTNEKTLEKISAKISSNQDDLNSKIDEKELEKKENEIKENVINIFQTEFEAKNQERMGKINEVENQSKTKTFFIGSDDKSVDNLRNEKVQIEIQIAKLSKILSETTSDENRALIQEKINSFNDQKIAIEKTISENEAKAGIFGWVKNIFRFKY